MNTFSCLLQASVETPLQHQSRGIYQWRTSGAWRKVLPHHPSPLLETQRLRVYSQPGRKRPGATGSDLNTRTSICWGLAWMHKMRHVSQNTTVDIVGLCLQNRGHHQGVVLVSNWQTLFNISGDCPVHQKIALYKSYLFLLYTIFCMFRFIQSEYWHSALLHVCVCLF